VCFISFFFFSSRRRHTRWPRDWSSDVCSSDLAVAADAGHRVHTAAAGGGERDRSHFRLTERYLSRRAPAGAVACAETDMDMTLEIGRASCRERVWIRGGGGAREKKRKHTLRSQ